MDFHDSKQRNESIVELFIKHRRIEEKPIIGESHFLNGEFRCRKLNIFTREKKNLNFLNHRKILICLPVFHYETDANNSKM